MMFWENFCSTEGDALVVWQGNRFGRCFLDLIVASGHALLAVLSIFYAGMRHTSLRRDHQLIRLLPSTWRTHLRTMCTCLLLLAPVADLVLNQLVLGNDLSPSSCLRVGTVLLSWAAHFAYLRTLANPLSRDARSVGEVPIVLLIVLCGVATSLRISALLSLSMAERGPALSFRGKLYTAITSALACTFYLVSAVRCSSTAGETPRRRSVDTSSQQSYIRLASDADDDAGQLGTAEDSNWFSLLSFWWVGRLMRRGYGGRLRNSDRKSVV